MSQTSTRIRTSPLRIHPTPFKPTLLSIPHSPFSPRLPLTPASPPPRTLSTQIPFTSTTTPVPPTTSAPSSPLSWMWQCHQCHRTYHLAATRRCLDDGHTFCSGSTTIKAWRKAPKRRIKKHRACASEFDYTGWKAWGRWRRGGTPRLSNASSSGGKAKGEGEGGKKDCWNTCNYPSECRWGTKFGLHTPLSATFPAPSSALTPSPPSPQPQLQPPHQHESERALQPSTNEQDIWTSLLASATRRKSIPPASPLSTSESSADADADVNKGSVAVDMLKDLMRRKTARRGGVKRASSYPVPLLAVARSVGVTEERLGALVEVDEEAVGDGDVDMDEFAPLVRVRSRGEMMDVDSV